MDVQKDRIILSHGDSIVEIHLFGATLTSWKVSGIQKLFVSSKAIYGPKAIRGGIPIVFPQFGAEPGTVLPQHGFARVSVWDFDGLVCQNAIELTAQFSLKPGAIPEPQRAKWPHDFKLTYTVTLTGNTLKTFLTVKNTSTVPFSFQSLLHTYFRAKIDQVSIIGLEGYPFVDKVSKTRSDQESRSKVTLDSEVDRVYERVKHNELTLCTGVGSIVIVKLNYDDVVVWNPWIAKSIAMADFEDAEYLEMVCVEVGNISPVNLQPSQDWTAGQTLICL